MGNKKQVNDFEIVGNVIHVGMPVYITEKLSKRILTLEVFANQKHKQEVAFDFINDRMSYLDNVKIKAWVSVRFQLRGRKTVKNDGKAFWFNSLEGLDVVML